MQRQELYRQVKDDTKALVKEWMALALLRKDNVFVIGCSTSEVIGEKIGTSGSMDIAGLLFDGFRELQQETGISLAFQCCEHLNRAIVMEKDTAKAHGLEEVTVIPATNAGGSMATYAYKHLKDPCVVEFVRADAGVDIGETMIGMHIKHVAVPLRMKQDAVGNAHVNGARTRPKLIGGQRAIYEV